MELFCPSVGSRKRSWRRIALALKKVLIPAENEKDIEEIPATVLKTVELELVSHMDQVLKKALVLDDPESLFRREPVGETKLKSEPPPFAEKVDDGYPQAKFCRK